MTLQQLKENRNEIINIITSELGAEYVKDVMTEMVNFIGYRDFAELSVEEYTKAVIEYYDEVNDVVIRKGIAASARLSDQNREAGQKMMSIR